MKKTKLLCLLLAFAMAFSCFSAIAFADTIEYTQDFRKINVGKYGNGTVSDDNGNHVFSLVPSSTAAYPAYVINSDEFGTSFGGSYKIEYRWKDNYEKETKDTHNILILSFGISNGASKITVKPCWLWASGSLRTPADIDNKFIATTTPGEWYTTVIDVDSASGIYNMKITDSDGKELSIGAGGNNRSLKEGTDTSSCRLNSISFTGCFNTVNSEFVLDYVKIYKQANKPVAKNARITGAAMEGHTLTAEADFWDEDGDEPDEAGYVWKISPDKSAWTAIEGETSSTYVCKTADIGKYIAVDITPKSKEEPKVGDTVTAETEFPVSVNRTPPKAENAVLSGSGKTAAPLTVSYTYVKSENGGNEGKTVFSWQQSEDGSAWNEIPGENRNVFIPSAEFAGKKIRTGVTPVDENGLSGETVYTSAIEITENTDAAEIFIAPDGNDENSGTIDAPFKTLDRARLAARDLKKMTSGGVIVNIRGGEYDFSKSVSFSKDDSGKGGAPIIYRAYNGEKASFVGGEKIDNSKISTVTSGEIYDKVKDPLAKRKLMKIDLADYQLSELSDYGYVFNYNYNPVEVTVNDSTLTVARYPNNVKDNAYLSIADVNTEGFQSRKTPVSMTVSDPDDRMSGWSESSIKEMMVAGFFVYDWYYAAYKVASFDKQTKTVTTENGTYYAPKKGGRICFLNIPEEIDRPGESYIDRENKVIYFYPFCDMENADVKISQLKDSMVKLESANYISFEGISFETTRSTPISAVSCKGLTFDGVHVRHTSNKAMSFFNCTDTAVRNCNIYDTAAGGVIFNCDDTLRKTLTPDGNIIENNVIHDVTRLYYVYAPAVQVKGVGTEILNNKLYNSPHSLAILGGNDILFQHNEVYNAVTDGGDAAAVYWGRNPSNLGFKILDNYFHDIGNAYGSYGTAAVFWDDGSSGPFVSGNVFYRATNTSENGGTAPLNHALKTYGGQYAKITNNIFVDMPAAFNGQGWNGGTGRYWGADSESEWYLWVYNKRPQGNAGIWELITKDVNFESEIWKKHYENTQWSWLWDKVSSKRYAEIADKDPKADKAELKKWAQKYMSDNPTNDFYKNIAVKITNQTAAIARANEADTYRAGSDILSSGNSMFKSYGSDFTLTEEGLAEVKKVIPDFKNVDMTLMGCKGNAEGGKPTVSNISYNKDFAGGCYTLAYDYADPDGDSEGKTIYNWYSAQSENGNYRLLTSSADKELPITEDIIGKYVKCRVQPLDVSGTYGDEVYSEPVKIENPKNSALKGLLVNGKALSGFKKDKLSYSLTVSDVPEIAAEVEETSANVEITKSSDELPVTYTITVTAPNGSDRTVYTFTANKRQDSGDEPQKPSPITPVTPGGGGAGGGGGGGSKTTYTANSDAKPEMPDAEEKFCFNDIINHWAKDSVMKMYELGLVSGTSETTFEPDRSITRAEFAALIARALKLSGGGSEFSDVAPDKWYADAVNACAEKGIISGNDGMFRPSDTITRFEMAVVISNAYSFLKKEAQTGAAEKFADKSEFPDWAADSVDACVSAGLLSGMTETAFEGLSDTTRAQAATVILKLIF